MMRGPGVLSFVCTEIEHIQSHLRAEAQENGGIVNENGASVDVDFLNVYLNKAKDEARYLESFLKK